MECNNYDEQIANKANSDHSSEDRRYDDADLSLESFRLIVKLHNSLTVFIRNIVQQTHSTSLVYSASAKDRFNMSGILYNIRVVRRFLQFRAYADLSKCTEVWCLGKFMPTMMHIYTHICTYAYSVIAAAMITTIAWKAARKCHKWKLSDNFIFKNSSGTESLSAQYR